MATLVDLTTYKTKSDLQLVEKHNQLVDAVISNFNYTLTQVSDPLPATATGYINDVLVIKPGSTLGYADPNSLLNFGSLFTNFVQNGSQTLSLGNTLAFNLFNFSSLGTYAIRGGTPGGLFTDNITVTQTTQTGDLTETHVVSDFSLTTESGAVTVTSGYFSINSLKVSDYYLPTGTPAEGKILRAAAAGQVTFQDLPEPVLFDGSLFTLKENKPLAFSSVAYPAFNAAFGASATTGVGFSNSVTGHSGSDVLYFTLAGKDLMYMIPTSGPPYIQLRGGLVLADTALMDAVSNPLGSLWYESARDSLVLVTSTGKKYISAQAITKSVNTEEVKDFALQPTSTLTVSAGTEEKPALNIGVAGLASTPSSLKVVVNSQPVAEISTSGIQSANSSAQGTAKIVLSTDLGINNPTNPTYSFAQASGLGVYRSSSNALAVSVKGAPVVEFSEGKVNAKGNPITNVKVPVDPSDAANKEYVDQRVPTGTTPGALPVVDPTASGRYIQSTAKYVNGTLEVGATSQPGAFKVNSALGGSSTIKAPVTNNNLVFELPANSLSGGVLQSSGDRTYWVSVDSITQGSLKTDGSVKLNAGLQASVNTTPGNPLIGKDGTGVYARTDSSPKVGFTANGARLLEVDGQTNVLKGRSDTYNAPLVRLTNSVGSYSTALSGPATPTYAFAGDSMTGLGQKKAQSLSLVVNGAVKMSAVSDGIDVHLGRIKGVADPTVESDAANKKYVDSLVKPRRELSFRVTSLPAGWTTGNSLILSIYDKSLIYQSAYAATVYESSSDSTKVSVPSNFNLNPDCQVYVNNTRLTKMASASGVRQATFASATSILLNYDVSAGAIITVHLPG